MSDPLLIVACTVTYHLDARPWISEEITITEVRPSDKNHHHTEGACA